MLMRKGIQDLHLAMTIERNDLLDARLRLPGHVVHRSFISETVLLNLQTGNYHGLNPVGGVMLDTVNQAPTVRQAAAQVAEKYTEDPAVVERDLLALCDSLVERGLMEVVETDDEAAA
jgi:Coenzyme PQQ synthesis protein D (PqqD)